MTIEAANRTATARTEVHRLFGQCVLRLQGYERLMKMVLAQHRQTGSSASLADDLKAQADAFDRQTLGTLAKHMMSSFLVENEPQGVSDLSNDRSEFEIHMRIGLQSEDFAKAEADLRDLVTLRNWLVHHFLEDHDLRSLSGCEKARAALVDASERIIKAWNALRVWAEDLSNMRSRVADVFNGPEFRNVIIEAKIK